MNSEELLKPLTPDRRRRMYRRRRLIAKPCPECGKTLKAYSDKQWEFVLLAHRALSKKHRDLQA